MPTAPHNPDRPAREASAPLTADVMTLLSTVGRDLNAIRDRDELLEFILTQCRLIFRCKAGSVFLYDASSDELVLEASHGDPPRTARGLRQKLGQGVAGVAAGRREAVRVEDVRRDARFAGHPVRDNGFYSFLCVPLLHFGELTGVVSLTMRQGGEAFTEDDLHLLEVLAGHFASAIRTVALFDETRRFNERLQDEVRRKTVELARLQAFTEHMVQSIPSGVVVVDRDRAVRFATRAAHRLLDRPLDEGEQLPLEGFGPRGADVDEALADVLSGGSGCELREAPYGADDDRWLLDVGVHPFSDPESNERGAVLVLTDVTEPATVRRHLDESQKLAVVGRLAAKVAHEMNNPLDAILRYIGLARKKMEPEDEAQQYLEKARKGLLRVGRIVKDLLQFSRSATTIPNEVDINRLLDEALDYFGPRIDEQGVEVDKQLDPSAPHFAVGSLFEVFTNLIKNALDAMPRGGRLTLRTQRQGDAVLVQVIDTGSGMNEETIRHVFDPFYSTKAPGKGTGLGMVICKDIVERRGGRIGVQSRAGKGTTVSVTVPVSGVAAA